jgi:hypothetical protein
MIIIGLLAMSAFALLVLPASLAARFLPPQIHAEDFSGTLWHGSAGRLTAFGRDAGACEWRIHPWPLLTLSLNADVHWVRTSALIDASLQVDRHGYRAQHIRGSAALEDLRDVGIPPGWRGTAALRFEDLTGDFGKVTSITGTVDLSSLASAAIATGANLGNYQIRFATDAISPEGDLTANIADQGGPLELQASAHYSPAAHTGLLSGTLKERPEADASLREQLQNLTQLRPRDASGRIPVELEFTL